MEPPTEEEIAARNDQGPGKPRKFREENNVLILTDNNMGTALKQYDFLLVEFYAPWCGHCKKLAPHYSGAATELYDENIALGKVDCTTSKKLHNKYKIDGFPTMHFFKYGKQVPYTGGNKQDSIVQWLRRHSMPSATELSTIQSVTSKQEMVPVMLVGYFPSEGETATIAQKAYFQAAEHKDHLNFFHTQSAEVAAHLGLESDGIAILKKFDEKQNVLKLSDFNSKNVAEGVSDFVTSMTYPLVSVFSKERAREIFSPKIMTHVLVFTDPETDHHAPALATATRLATQFRGSAQVISIEATDDAILTHFKVDAGSLPAAVVMDVDLMERYPYASESDSNFYEESEYDTLAAHVQAVVDRDL